MKIGIWDGCANGGMMDSLSIHEFKVGNGVPYAVCEIYNPVTQSVVKRVELPHLYNTERQAWNAVEFFRALGGEWADHDSIHSHPVQVNYTVEPIRLPN
jgi:hypothetical protein